MHPFVIGELACGNLRRRDKRLRKIAGKMELLLDGA